MTMATSVVGVKAQITLPKAVREALNIRGKGERVGFILEGNRVILTRAAVVPVAPDYTDAELDALERLSRQSRGRIYRSWKTFLRAHKRLLGV